METQLGMLGGKLKILDLCFRPYCKLYSRDISRGMEGRSVNIYIGARIPEMVPLVS